MKKTGLLLPILMLALNVFAQSGSAEKAPPAKGGYNGSKARNNTKLYIATSTGLNNTTGIIGVLADVPVAPAMSVEGGLGISDWGYKFTAGAKYYFKPNYLGWAVGAGLTHNGGLRHFHNTMETIYGTTEPVILDLKPQTNFYAAAFSYVNLGRKHRFYTMLGWSVPLTGDTFHQESGSAISKQSKRVINILSPGGLVVAIGFSFSTAS